MDNQSVNTTNLCHAGTSSSLWYLWETNEYFAETETETMRGNISGVDTAGPDISEPDKKRLETDGHR